MRSRICVPIILMLFFGLMPIVVFSQTQVSVEFEVLEVKWGTMDTSTTPEPGDRNVPLTVVIHQKSDYYLRGIVGYLYLTWQFSDSSTGENVSKGYGEAIETDNDAGDVIPHGRFYITFYLDIDENATKGDYDLELNLTYTAINDSIFYEGAPKILNITVRIPNRAPEIKRTDPESTTVTVYPEEEQEFSVDADDPDGDSLYYEWSLDGDTVASGRNVTKYVYRPTKNDIGSHRLSVEVSDGDLSTTHTWSISVENRDPEIYAAEPSSATVTIIAGDSKTFSIKARDPDNDTLYYEWVLDGEVVKEGYNATNYTYCTTEDDFGTHTLVVRVSDNRSETTNTWTINVDLPSRTKIYPSADYVYAGHRTNLSMTIRNNLWDGTVDISVSYPEYVAMLGDTHWTFHNVSPGDNLTVELIMYVPSKAIVGMYGEIVLIGQTLQLTVDIDFTDIYGNTYSESHDVGLIIRGEIVMKLYDVSVDPLPVAPGGIVKISATVLNMGVATAQFVNVSVVPSSIVGLTAESMHYLGAIEPDAPTPFSLKFKVSEDASFGEHNATILIRYLDDLYYEKSKTYVVTFVVANITSGQGGEQSQQQVWSPVFYGYLGIAIAAAIATGIIVIRRRQVS